jgi:hypothetical protein
MNKDKFDTVSLHFFKKNVEVKEISIDKQTADIIMEAIRFYWLNAERLESNMEKAGSQRLTYAAFNLKRDLQETMDILYDR